MQILGSLDAPADGSVIAGGTVGLGGWVFRTDTGGRPQALLIVYHEIGGQGRTVICQQFTIYSDVERPDVYAVYHPSYPAVTTHSGYNIVAVAPPPGQWRIDLSWADTGVPQWNGAREVTIV